MKFLHRLKKLLTFRNFIGFVAVIITSVTFKYCLILYLPNISAQSLEFLLPSTIGIFLVRILTLEFYDHMTMNSSPDINSSKNILRPNILMSDANTTPTQSSQTINIKQEETSNIKQEDQGNAANVFEPVIVAEETYRGIYNPQNRTRSPIPFPHPDERVSKINDLDRKGREQQFFKIVDKCPRGSWCKIAYYKDYNDPSLNDDIEKLTLLKKLWQLFPLSDGRLDNHRLMGRVVHNIEDSMNQDDWPYKSDQRRTGQNPWFNFTRPEGYYQPWASDIADSLDKFAKNRGTGNIKPILDKNSAIFLTTFENHIQDSRRTTLTRQLRRL